MPNFLFTWVDTFEYDPMRLLGRPVQEFFFLDHKRAALAVI